MRVVVLGGSGVQGRAAARVAKRDPAVDNVLLVARNFDRLRAAADNLGADAIAADVADADAIGKVLRPGDIVLNTAAPFFEIGAAPARAAIAAGAHYVDIGDDWEASEPILGLHDAALERGLVVVTGFGGAPGLDSMLAIEAMGQLDEVEDIVTAWSFAGGGGTGPESLIPLIHFLQCCVGPIPVIRDGERVLTKPLQPTPVRLPDGRLVEGYTIGSPEAVTLQRGRAQVRGNVNLMLCPRRIAEQLDELAAAIRSGGLSLMDGARLLASGGGSDPEAGAAPAAETTPSLFGWASGRVAGHPARAMAWFERGPARSYDFAGRVLGMAPGLIAAGRLAPGAMSVEAALTPREYFAAAAQAAGSSYLIRAEVAVDNPG